MLTLVIGSSKAMVTRFLGISKRLSSSISSPSSSRHFMMSSSSVTPDSLCAEAAKLFLSDSGLTFSPTSGGVNNIVVSMGSGTGLGIRLGVFCIK